MARFAKYYLAASVAILTFLVYVSALQNGFVSWDDPEYVYENLHIRSWNWSFLKWAFLDFYASNWHPLTWLSHALDYAVWGLNPLGHHLTNNILHAFTTFVVTLLTVRLVAIGRGAIAKNAPEALTNDRAILAAGGVTGLLFGLHPLHVESVAWVAERKDLLCALFFLLGISAYTKYAILAAPEATGKSRPSRSRAGAYLLAFLFFVLAIFSKPMAVSFPVVLLLLDWYPFGRIRSFPTVKAPLVEKIPFLLVSGISVILTIAAQKAVGAMALTAAMPLSTRLLVAAKSLIVYLGKMTWPLNLIPYYPYPHPDAVSPFAIEYLSSILLLLAITTLCVRRAGRQKVWLSTWSYYLVTLLPVIGIVQVGGQALADRYTYLPSLGPFLILGLLAARIAVPVRAVKSRGRITTYLALAAAAGVCVFATCLTVRQIGIWKNNFTLWDCVIEKQPAGVPLAYFNRGLDFLNVGLYDKALADFDQAIALSPYEYRAVANRGMTFVKMGRLDQALADFNRALELNPVFAEALNNRGSVYRETGRIDKAIADYDRAIALNARYQEAFQNRGVAYERLEQHAKAIADFDTALALNPISPEALNNRGIVYARTGRLEEAIADYDKAIALNPRYEKAYYNRGILRLRQGDATLAALDFRQACDYGNELGCNALKSL